MIAPPITLAWSPSVGAPPAGYAVYYRPANSSVTNRLDVGALTVAVITGLDVGTSYEFCVTAYDAEGLESIPSDPITYSPPAMTRLKLAQQALGCLVQFRSAPASLCRIEYSNQPGGAEWLTAGLAVADLDGKITFLDLTQLHSVAARFYRAVRL